MKFFKYLFVAVVALIAFSVTSVSAKEVRTPVYMFGFAASFNDSTVYFTEIQKIDSAWTDSKNNFLLSRNNYSYQLRDYIQNKLGKQHPTCIVIFNKSQKKCAKKYASIKRKYTTYTKGKKKHTSNYDVKYFNTGDFSFSAIDVQPVEEKPMTKEEKKADKKAAREKANQQRKIMQGKGPGNGQRPEGGPGGMGGHGGMGGESGMGNGF